MCLILFSYKSHPKYRLILAANRDEFYKRPTASSQFWAENPNILGGRDLEKMGTWIGITRTGRFAAITNYRDPSLMLENAKSRGELVSNFLFSNDSPGEYLNKVKLKSSLYKGFNLLVGDSSSFLYFSKLKNVEEIIPGIHGMSNDQLNTPWPKVERGKNTLEKCIQQKTSLIPECLFELLADSNRVTDSELPNTGVGLEWERILSPIFVQSADYGTRSSTVLTIDYQNHVTFTERSFIKDPNEWAEVSYQFDILGS
jgi:uncharacterized protein with NRDE domain